MSERQPDTCPACKHDSFSRISEEGKEDRFACERCGMVYRDLETDPDNVALEEIMAALEAEWMMGGLSGGLYGDFAKEVARRFHWRKVGW